MNSFFLQNEVLEIGLKKVGSNVLISRKASIYGENEILIGDNVRIDDYCILSGPIVIGNFIHIAAYCALYGGNSGIIVEDFANFSSRISVYAISDDYSGNSLTNPMVPEKYKNLDDRPVRIGRHVIIGSGSVILPGVNIGEGCAIGALSLVNKNVPAWTIIGGVPAKYLMNREKHLLELEKKLTLDGVNKDV